MLFAANYLAFSSKTPRVLLLNTLRFAADCTAFCSKTLFHLNHSVSYFVQFRMQI